MNVPFNLSHDCMKRCCVISESIISNTKLCPPHKITQGARLRPRRGRKWTVRPRQTFAPMCSSRREQCGARARPWRATSALAVPIHTQRAASRLWGAISYEPAVACRHPAVLSWREQPAQSFELLCGPAAALEHPQLSRAVLLQPVRPTHAKPTPQSVFNY